MVSARSSASGVTPFKVNIPDSELELLAKKLELARMPEEPAGYTEQQGVPAAKMRELVQYWRKIFLPNWRKHEAKLNELPMFKTVVPTEHFGELDIHFVHQRSANPNAIPLLFVHGWPGGFFEAIKLLPLLTKGGPDGGPTFHVVAPSLPNFGFSGEVKRRGFNLRHYGEVCHKLMRALGYDEYAVQGGDWGSIIARIMGRTHHDDGVKAVHVNLAHFNPVNLLWNPWALLKTLVVPWSKAEWGGLWNGLAYIREGNRYYEIQRTRPVTVGYCLEDSPVALLGWIYEKLVQWTDGYPWTNDEILNWVSLYWFSTSGPGASVRIYFEAEHPDASVAQKGDTGFWQWTKVPLGLTQFPKDIVGVAAAPARTLGSIIFENWSPDGGHFAAIERPEVLANDLRRMFAVEGTAYGLFSHADGSMSSRKSS